MNTREVVSRSLVPRCIRNLRTRGLSSEDSPKEIQDCEYISIFEVGLHGFWQPTSVLASPSPYGILAPFYLEWNTPGGSDDHITEQRVDNVFVRSLVFDPGIHGLQAEEDYPLLEHPYPNRSGVKRRGGLLTSLECPSPSCKSKLFKIYIAFSYSDFDQDDISVAIEDAFEAFDIYGRCIECSNLSSLCREDH